MEHGAWRNRSRLVDGAEAVETSGTNFRRGRAIVTTPEMVSFVTRIFTIEVQLLGHSAAFSYCSSIGGNGDRRVNHICFGSRCRLTCDMRGFSCDIKPTFRREAAIFDSCYHVEHARGCVLRYVYESALDDEVGGC